MAWGCCAEPPENYAPLEAPGWKIQSLPPKTLHPRGHGNKVCKLKSTRGNEVAVSGEETEGPDRMGKALLSAEQDASVWISES